MNRKFSATGTVTATTNNVYIWGSVSLNKLPKIIIQLCFWIWFANFMLPSALGAFWHPLGWVFEIGAYLTYTLIALAVVAFAIPIINKRREKQGDFQHDILILHDLPSDIAETLLRNISDLPSTKTYCASNSAATCKGHYDCWLKKPGVCAMQDGVHNLGQDISQAKKLIIISKGNYGGLSMEIKRALDRSISFALPFFDVRGKELHHQVRYPKNGGEILACFYNGAKLSQDERTSITEVIEAIGLNMDRNKCKTVFYENEHEFEAKGAIV